jgi:hypothetical protein
VGEDWGWVLEIEEWRMAKYQRNLQRNFQAMLDELPVRKFGRDITIV